MATTEETQPDNVSVAAGSKPNQDSVPVETQPNHEPTPLDTHPNHDYIPNETHANQEEPMTHETQTQPSEEPMTHEMQTQPTEEPMTNETHTQPIEEPMTNETHTQPIEEPMTNETQTQPSQEPMIHETQTQPSQEPMSHETQTQPSEEGMTHETQTLPSEEGMPHETQAQASKEGMPHETQPPPNEEAMPHETQPSEESMPHETQPSNDAMPHETQHSNELMAHETQPSSESMPLETQPSHEAMHHETQPSHEAMHHETQPSHEAMHHESQPSHEAMPHETQPSHEQIPHELQPSNEQNPHEAQPSNEQIPHELQPSHDQIPHETPPSHEQILHETPPSHEQILHETPPSHEQILHEAQPGHEQIPHELHPSHEQISHGTQQSHEQMAHGTQPNHEQMPHETQPNYEPMSIETEQKYEAMHHQTQAKYEPMHHETQAKYEQMHHEAHDNYMLMTPETQHNDVMMTADTHHTDMMMTPETHHNDMMMTTETQTDNVWMNPEMQAQNMLVVHERQPDNALALHDTQQNNALAIMDTQPNNEVTSPETQPNKRRKKKSIVWEHFTIETVSAGCRRACCKQCKQTFAYSTGSKVAGTSHLKRHIAKGTCLAVLRNQDNNNQLTPYTPRTSGTDPPKRRYRSPSSAYVPFDQDRCRLEIARMIIMHDYPLHMVEHPGFITFVQNLQPRFDKVSFNTVQGDCVATYLREKHSLLKFIESIPGRVCLTLDMWTSNQTLGYVFISGHFVDSEWKLQKRLLNVVMEPYPDSQTAFSHAVAACLSDWSLEGKVFSLTLDHQLGEAGLENLRPLLCIQNPLVLKGQLLVRNCIARTLSSMTKDVLGAGRDIVKKIRDSVKYVKTSESHEEKFLELKQQLQVPSEKSLSLDDQTKWNTTYQMLVAASELKEVFSCLDTSDPDYEEAPSMEDWKLVETLCTFLKPLYDAANILTTTTKPTAITFFHEAWKLQSDLACTVTSEDPFVSSFAKAMHEKIGKYWNDCCYVLAIAVVMDPRFKMKLVEFSFTKLYGEDAPEYIRIVDDGVHELFLEYTSLPLPLTPTYAEEGNNMRAEDYPGGGEGGLLSDNGLTDFDMYIMETSSQQMKTELDQYLEESLLPRVHDFDVLGWWKLNKLKYPTLSKMARDILSIPVSTVSNDSVFDTVPKEMDSYRSSLRPETVEALICAKDWFQYGSAEASTAPVKMEF